MIGVINIVQARHPSIFMTGFEESQQIGFVCVRAVVNPMQFHTRYLDSVVPCEPAEVVVVFLIIRMFPIWTVDCKLVLEIVDAHRLLSNHAACL